MTETPVPKPPKPVEPKPVDVEKEPKPEPPPPGPDDFKPPKEPTAEEIPEKLESPTAVDPAAVETVTTTEGEEKKYGWQDPAAQDFTVKDPCVHMGIVQARKQIVNHEVGHEWICTCGTIFVVTINKGDKKVLSEKPAEPVVNPL